MALLEQYAPFVGEQFIFETKLLAQALRGARVQHVNSTKTGGGVAEILTKLVPLMRDVGVDAQWTTLKGTPAFFDVTKSFHNALHGSRERISDKQLRVYEQVNSANYDVIDRDADFVIIHDPQPLGLVPRRENHLGTWIWRCHIDVASADRRVWQFLSKYIRQFDAALFHLPQYTRDDLPIPQFVVPPSIDPLSEKNRDVSAAESKRYLARYRIPTDEPYVLQAARFDRLKDPFGVLEAHRLLSHNRDVRLVYAGNFAPDDPEGMEVYDEFMRKAGRNRLITVIPNPDPNDLVVNVLQRNASIVIQKSIREGFGLSVTEGMWKARPVIGGNTGGIRYQIVDGVTGYLVNTPDGAAFRMGQILANPTLARSLGEAAKLRVAENFLVPNYLKNWLCVLLAVKYPGEGVRLLSGDGVHAFRGRTRREV